MDVLKPSVQCFVVDVRGFERALPMPGERGDDVCRVGVDGAVVVFHSTNPVGVAREQLGKSC